MKKTASKVLSGILLICLLTGCNKPQSTVPESTKENQDNATATSEENNQDNKENNKEDNNQEYQEDKKQASGNDSSITNTDVPIAENAYENGYDLPVSDTETAMLERDCMSIAQSIIKQAKNEGIKIKSREDASDSIDRIMIHVISDLGYPVRTPGIYRELKNYEAMEHFILQAQNHQPGEVLLYQIHSETGFSREKFSYDGQAMYHLQANVSLSENGEPQITSVSYCRIKEWNYTEKGWFCFELCAPQPPEAMEVIDSNVMMRILPMNEHFTEIAEQYLLPIGYQGNNLLCSEWNETQLDALDYNGLYEYLYKMEYQKQLDEEQSSSGIREDEFSELMMKYLPVTKEQLKQYAAYDPDKKVFLWNRLGCFNYVPSAFGGSIPEITSIVEYEDGTAVITVDAVCESSRDDHVFTHELTVKFLENGQIMFLGNKILEQGHGLIPDYQYRISDN